MATGSGAGRGGAGASWRYVASSSRKRSSSLTYELGALLPKEQRESPVGQLGYAQLSPREDVKS